MKMLAIELDIVGLSGFIVAGKLSVEEKEFQAKGPEWSKAYGRCALCLAAQSCPSLWDTSTSMNKISYNEPVFNLFNSNVRMNFSIKWSSFPE